MFFNSITFFIFLAIVFALHWLPLSKNRRHQNAVLLVASYVFYGWWDVRFLSLIILSSFVDFFIGRKMDQEEDQKKRKRLLQLSLLVNLGILFTFKYFNFFVNSFMDAFSIEHSSNLIEIILPVGISFYTFQTLSYTIDIYFKKLKHTESWLDFFTFVAFFPQLVAGPIERAKKFLPQIAKNRSFEYGKAVEGSRLILYGMFKKVVIADNAAEMANIIFHTESPYSGLMSMFGVFLFAVQIYCDFSGYSDIAIGTAKLFNVDLMVNFKRPYFAKSFKEFWSRWHISLSTWFRDYVYIPLGGSREGKFRTYKNMFLTFLISGLWHGANWTFVIWGAIHGGFLAIEKMLGRFRPKRMFLTDWLATFLIVLFAWIFFRAENLGHALDFIQNMFVFDGSFTDQLKNLVSSNSQVTIGHAFITFALLIAFFVIELNIEFQWFAKIYYRYKLVRHLSYFALFFGILLFGAFKNKVDFIYFQF